MENNMEYYMGKRIIITVLF